VARFGGADGAGVAQTPILSYAAKYASCFYGPFARRPKTPQFGDRAATRWIGNAREAMRKSRWISKRARHDYGEPAMPYLDILRMARTVSTSRWPAYQFRASSA